MLSHDSIYKTQLCLERKACRTSLSSPPIPMGHSHCWLLGPASVHCTECAGCSGPAPWGSGHMCSERIQEQLPVATLCTHHIRRNACPPLPRLQLLPQLSPGSLRNCHQTPLSLLNLISPLRSPFDLQCIRTPWLCKPPLLTFIS